MVNLEEPFATLWRNKNAFAEAEKIQGNVFRALETRRTLRFEVNNRGYFIKHHYGTTLKEVMKNWLSLRLPVLGADREWHAIHRLSALGVDTMKGVAFGQRGWNPLRRESFIITEELTETQSLEDYCADWLKNPPLPATKRVIIRRVAEMVRKMHAGGINHRDCYLCHFLLHLPFNGCEKDLKISIIDLHRAQIRPAVPKRWRDKDLTGLYFSAMNVGLTQADLARFLITYFQAPLRQIIRDEHPLLQAAVSKARKIRERTIRKSL